MSGRVLVWLVAMSFPAAVAAQSLGEVAVREQQQRGKRPAASRVYTEEDLKKAHESKTATVTVLPPLPAPGVSTSPPAAKDEDESESRAQKEKAWRAEANGRRAAVRAAEQRVVEIQEKLNGLRKPQAQSQPLPIDALRQDPLRQFTQDEERRGLEGELQAAQARLADARRRLDELDDEARRNGVPPGWVREP